MFFRRGIWLLASSLILAVCLGSETDNIDPDIDTSVFQSAPTYRTPWDENFLVCGRRSTGMEMIGLIGFYDDDIPSGSYILNATLHVKGDSVGGGTMKVYGLTEYLDNDYINWGEKPTNGSSSYATMNIVSGEWTSANVTTLVQDMMSRSVKWGVALRSYDNEVRIRSSDSSSEPYIAVEYVSPSNNTPPVISVSTPSTVVLPHYGGVTVNPILQAYDPEGLPFTLTLAVQGGGFYFYQEYISDYTTATVTLPELATTFEWIFSVRDALGATTYTYRYTTMSYNGPTLTVSNVPQVKGSPFTSFIPSVVAKDFDGSSLSYTVAVEPSDGVVVEPSTGRITLPGDSDQSFTLSFTAVSPVSGRTVQQFSSVFVHTPIIDKAAWDVGASLTNAFTYEMIDKVDEIRSSIGVFAVSQEVIDAARQNWKDLSKGWHSFIAEDGTKLWRWPSKAYLRALNSVTEEYRVVIDSAKYRAGYTLESIEGDNAVRVRLLIEEWSQDLQKFGMRYELIDGRQWNIGGGKASELATERLLGKGYVKVPAGTAERLSDIYLTTKDSTKTSFNKVATGFGGHIKVQGIDFLQVRGWTSKGFRGMPIEVEDVTSGVITRFADNEMVTAFKTLFYPSQYPYPPGMPQEIPEVVLWLENPVEVTGPVNTANLWVNEDYAQVVARGTAGRVYGIDRAAPNAIEYAIKYNLLDGTKSKVLKFAADSTDSGIDMMRKLCVNYAGIFSKKFMGMAAKGLVMVGEGVDAINPQLIALSSLDFLDRLAASQDPLVCQLFDVKGEVENVAYVVTVGPLVVGACTVSLGGVCVPSVGLGIGGFGALNGINYMEKEGCKVQSIRLGTLMLRQGPAWAQSLSLKLLLPEDFDQSTVHPPPPVSVESAWANTTDPTLPYNFGVAAKTTDGTPPTYTWEVVTKPEGASVTMTDDTASTTNVVVDTPGAYLIRVYIKDSKGNVLQQDFTQTLASNETVTQTGTGGPGAGVPPTTTGGTEGGTAGGGATAAITPATVPLKIVGAYYIPSKKKMASFHLKLEGVVAETQGYWEWWTRSRHPKVKMTQGGFIWDGTNWTELVVDLSFIGTKPFKVTFKLTNPDGTEEVRQVLVDWSKIAKYKKKFLYKELAF